MAEQTQSSTPYHLRIQPSKGWVALRLDELWQYRELLAFLVWRDVKVRYKQTVLGVLWVLIQPLTTTGVFSLFFGSLANIPSDGVPYPLWSFTGMVIWQFFANGLNSSSNSLVGSANLIKKIYFPRLIIPLSTILAGLVDFVIIFGVLLLFILLSGYGLTVNIIFLLPLLFLAFLTALGVGLWLSAMNVQFRDVRYLMTFLTQLWMFITPIAYPSSLIDDPTLRALYGLNPMTGVVEGFRWALLGTDTAPGATLWVSVAATLVILISGLYYFRRMEKTFADVV